VTSEKLREKTLKRWEDPDYAAFMAASTREASRKRWQDPKYRVLMAERRQAVNRDPEFRRKLSEARRRRLEEEKRFKDALAPIDSLLDQAGNNQPMAKAITPIITEDKEPEIVKEESTLEPNGPEEVSSPSNHSL
jgi:hypothetical protein